MSIKDNFATFKLEEAHQFLIVESFDNHEFEVRIGTLEVSKIIGIITATNDDELNVKLANLHKSQG